MVTSATPRRSNGREAEMDKFPKTRKELNDLLDERLAGWECQGRSMFGGRGYFVNGNMFSGSHGDTIAIRLSEPDRIEFLEEYPEASLFEPMPGRAMKEYVTAPPALLAATELLDHWLRRSLEYVRTLPPKEKKPRKK
jgi:TfoX/Sxy family transcriptional regulator of competence genes